MAPPPGLLRLEELLRRFLISRDSLSVRVLDQSLDPTPLLKEIRDDKVATIIVHANASVSYHILRKVLIPVAATRPPLPPPTSQSGSIFPPANRHSALRHFLQASELGMTSAFYKYILTTMVGPTATLTVNQGPLSGPADHRSHDASPFYPFFHCGNSAVCHSVAANPDTAANSLEIKMVWL